MKKYLVYLHYIGFTQNKLRELFYKNIDFKNLYENISLENLKDLGIRTDQINRIIDGKNKIKEEKLDKIISNLGVKIITLIDEQYPKNLKEIQNPPFILYVRGNIKFGNYFSVIGARKIKKYAQKAGEFIIPDLLNHFTIVSGGAGGCDSLAHKLALENNGKTIVVFGTGIDVCYPETNREMYEEVVKKGGGLISIFPIGTIGSNFSFPVRNEIVSGISSGVLVLQAQRKSGTLITARLALEQSRDLFCIPGDIFSPDFEGCNDLIKSSSAKLVTNSNDILEEYNYKQISLQKTLPVFETEIEQNIFDLLKYNLSLSLDDLIEKTSYNYGEITSSLASLELSGIIKKDMFGKYEIIF